MTRRVFFDAMIQRADLAVEVDENQSPPGNPSFIIDNLQSGSIVAASLRKPDFQRETNQWTPKQVVGFLESFLDGELVPAVILWRSKSYTYVIDGGHRLSALRAWIENDYGAGTISQEFFNYEITAEQKRVHTVTQKLVDEKIGPFKTYREAVLTRQKTGKLPPLPLHIANRIGSFTQQDIQAQWVQGDANKAESSFFKINTQGTALDDTEELLLRNRERSCAIAARSIVRSGTGHKYWSKFPHENQQKIEERAKELNGLLFQPELKQPIKTLDLPLGGAVSPLNALHLLMRLVCVSNTPQGEVVKGIESFPKDTDGAETIKALQGCLNVLRRVTGNSGESLGLHPAVYFYSDRGKHSADLFLGVCRLVAIKLSNNDGEFFKKWIAARPSVEEYLIQKKPLLMQILQHTRSTSRMEKVKDIFECLVTEAAAGKVIEDSAVLEWADLESDLINMKAKPKSINFSDDTKSHVFLITSLGSALKCPICKGYLEPAKAASYDHVTGKAHGGNGAPANAQITHPFCNTGIKG